MNQPAPSSSASGRRSEAVPVTSLRFRSRVLGLQLVTGNWQPGKKRDGILDSGIWFEQACYTVPKSRPKVGSIRVANGRISVARSATTCFESLC
jgi:hypothetical protein